MENAPRFCIKCGSHLAEDGTCPNCTAAAQTEPQPAPQPEPQPEPQAAPQYAPPPPQDYAPPQPGYAPPQPGYAPPRGYAPPQQGYAPPQPGYVPPRQPYGQAPYAQQPPQANRRVETARAATRQVLPGIKTYWSDPIQTTYQALREGNMSLAAVLLVINMLAAGLFVFFSIHSVTGSFGKDVDIEAPFFSILLWGILLAAAALAILAVVLFLVLKLLKVGVTFKDIAIVVGINSIPCSVCVLASILFALIGWYTLVALLLALSTCVWVVACVLVMFRIFQVRTTGTALCLASIACLLVLIATGWTNIQLGAKAVGQVEIAGNSLEDAVEEIVDGLEDMDLSKIGSLF